MSQPIRVLLLNQFYWPDGAPTAALLDDLARGLADRGCEVTVICGNSSYLSQAGDTPPPVRILHMPTSPYSRNPLIRMLSWLSFLGGALVRAVFDGKFDLVLTLTSPPGIAIVGLVLKKLRGSRFCIWEMDVYPDVAFALGAVKPGSTTGKISQMVFTAIRRQADGIMALGDCMRDLLLQQGLNPERISVTENWAKSSLIQRREFTPCPPLNVLYSGNLGLAHDIDTLAQVMLHLKDEEGIRFTIAGGGVRRAALQKFCETHDLDKVEFRGYSDRDRLNESLANCHVGLVTLRPECLGAVVPSKAYSFLAAGRPFLYIGPASATPAILARQGCGWAFETGAADRVAAQLLTLRDNPALLQRASTQATELFEEQYDLSRGVSRISDLLLNGLASSNAAHF